MVGAREGSIYQSKLLAPACPQLTHRLYSTPLSTGLTDHTVAPLGPHQVVARVAGVDGPVLEVTACQVDLAMLRVREFRALLEVYQAMMITTMMMIMMMMILMMMIINDDDDDY